jgi:hypothetical protein
MLEIGNYGLISRAPKNLENYTYENNSDATKGQELQC